MAEKAITKSVPPMTDDKAKKEYLKIAIQKLSETDILDAWWRHLAEKHIWVSKSDEEHKILDLHKLDATHLYNIRNVVLRMAPEGTLLPGASFFVGVISKILVDKTYDTNPKKSSDDDGDLPF